jgi:hypothetical protein
MPTATQTTICASCGKAHPTRDIELSYGLPDVIFNLDKEARSQRAKTSGDICMLDGHRMFLRGVMPLPVEGRERPYRIGAWIEVSSEDFHIIHELWTDPGQSSRAPFAGKLANEIYNAPGSLGLPVGLQLTGPTSRPDILMRDPGHELYRWQNEGVTEHEASELSERVSPHAV